MLLTFNLALEMLIETVRLTCEGLMRHSFDLYHFVVYNRGAETM